MRLDNWPERLESLLADKRLEPFRWGLNDCTRFATEAEIAIFGTTRFEKYKQSHKTKKQAFAYLKRIGVNSTWELWDKHCERKPVSMCQRGDFVGYIHSDGEAIGVCLGGVFACPGPDGLEFMQMSEAQIGWSIDG